MGKLQAIIEEILLKYGIDPSEDAYFLKLNMLSNRQHHGTYPQQEILLTTLIQNTDYGLQLKNWCTILRNTFVFA
jgi:hypothetical protein